MGASLHILVVDDRPDSVLFLTELLLARRHRVEACNNGTMALEAIVRRHRTADAYDLVISDVSMPGMDGLTLVKEIRRRQMLLPVALYTAYGSMYPNLAQQAHQHGVLMVLDKPIELRRIEELLDDVQARRSGSHRVEKEQPFFGTSRVARSSTTTAYRRETAQPSELEHNPASGGYALEPKPMIPMPPPKPMSPPASVEAPTLIPLPPPPPSRIPSPIRTPLPFAVENQDPHTPSLPSFRTPPPQDTRREGTARSVNAKFRTPLPFLQPNNVPPSPAPTIPPAVASAPPVRSGPPSPMTVLPSAESGVPTQPPQQQPVTTRFTTSFVRRAVTQPAKETGGDPNRPSGNVVPNQPTENDSSANPTGTSRLRRTVTGSYIPSTIAAGQNSALTNQQQGTPGTSAIGAARAVACAHCRKVFMVESRPDAYTAVCVHCGQLNRIDPL